LKHLKLVINNKKKQNKFFDKQEFQIILNLYAKMVSGGEWKDYGLNISKLEISFDVYKGAAEYPAYRITKSLDPKNNSEKYLVKDNLGKTIKKSKNLEMLIEKTTWKKFTVVG
jgi:hypothetical protein